VGFFVPRLSNLGILIGLAMMAVAALRLRLLGREVRPALALYALLGGALWVTAYLAAVRWFEPHQGVYVLSVATALAFGLAVVREARRAQSVARERVQRLAVLGRFSDQLAHDLRNPLAALKGALQFLAVEREQGRSIDAQSGFLDLMLGQVARLQNVIDNYQRIAKVEPVLARGSLNDVVRDVLGLQRFAVVSGVNLKTELSEELPECDMDRELIATTLENILRNACEAMPSGGTVTVRTERGGVDSLLLSVQDEGQGMDPRELSRATDEFFTTKATGTGLGLNFAARVARAHGGTLSLTSNVNRGTTVRLRIPLGRA
jgi:signal transduction histidine kinase